MSSRGIKVVLVGDSNTGKTSLIQRLITDEFSDINAPTVVSSCFEKVVHLKDRDMTINVWDTAGQERFRSLVSNFFREAQGIIICYDVTSMKSFSNIDMWMEEEKEKADANVVCMLVGCKCDEPSVIEETKLNEIIQKYNIQHMVCSSKTGQNVSEVFISLCEKINEILQDPNNDEDDDSGIFISKRTVSTKEDKKCC